MDLVERIETTRFLGNEFLTWLWFKCELYDSVLDIGDHARCELAFENSLQLISCEVADEKLALRCGAPTSSPEASEALRQGKWPSRAILRLVMGQEEFVFGFNAQTFALSGVKLTEVLTEEADERFYERMRLLEQLEAALNDLYAEFLTVRLSSLWNKELLPVLRAWVKGRETLTTRQYAGLLKRAERERSVRVARHRRQ
jgi:hypothetical protein